MVKLIIYILEANAVLAFLYLLYILILRKETFFTLNRFFLLGILIASLLFPLLSVDFNSAKVSAVERPIEEISKFRMSYYEAMALWDFEDFASTKPDESMTPSNKSLPFHWPRISFTVLFVVYAIGIVACLSKTLWTLRWILNMIAIHPQEKIANVKVVKISKPIAPFSFLKYVFVHDALVGTPEFDHILAHEKIHIQQRHSFDLIFVQLLAAFCWFNPAIWQLVKSLKTTHEYIADNKIINLGYSLVEYQTLLLKQLISNNSCGLVHNFNLSFIKKRITMMKNKKSGWSGKVKVAMTIAITIICSAVIMQCNSKIDDQVSLKSGHKPTREFAQGINLPVLPDMGYTFKGDSTDVLNFTIAENQLSINGTPYEANEIVPMIKSSGLPSVEGTIIMRVDKDQTMELVREVQMELRKADRRKILYLGQTTTGRKVEATVLLPPPPDRESLPKAEDLIAAGKMDLLKIDLGDNAGATNQQRVYDFVKDQINKQSSDYVVSAKFSNEDTYHDYLLNFVYIKEGFNQIYRERAQAMFGKDFNKLEKKEYLAVRKDIPTAISIAESH